MEEIVKEEKIIKRNKVLIVTIVISSLIILGCAGYLINSFYMLKKYDVDSFKLDKYEIPTFNSAIKSKKKLVAAYEKKNEITLKYDIEKITLNDVFDYLGKLSLEDYVVVIWENDYFKTINEKNDIQVRIKVGSNHLVFEYKIGIEKEVRENDNPSSEIDESKENDEEANVEKQNENSSNE